MTVAERKTALELVRRESGIALVIFDSTARYNTLSSGVINELEHAVDWIATDESIQGAVLISGKPDSFIIGADILEIRRMNDAEALKSLSRTGQRILNKLESVGKPVIAAIHGTCLGGGLELALSCSKRIATYSEFTRLGLPETRLGIIPGLGGTQRLPRLVGLKTALDMILQGEPVAAEEALNSGLVNKLCAPDQLIETAEGMTLALINRSPAPESGSSWKITSHCPIDVDQEKARKLIAISDRAVKIRTKGHYPAQPKALEAIATGVEHGFAPGLERESELFAELAVSETASNLISLFMTTDYAVQSAKSLVEKFGEAKINSVAIVGAGSMGTSLAQLSSAHGIDTLLRTGDSRLPQVEEQLRMLASKHSYRQATRSSQDAQQGPSPHGQHQAGVQVIIDDSPLGNASLVIESGIEDLASKRQTLARCEATAGRDAIIAVNTSSLTVGEIFSQARFPDRCLGLHFFHPVDKMPLVEIVTHPATSKKALATAAGFIIKLGKMPLIIKDGPGFLINRILAIHLVEVARLSHEGTPLNWIEEASVDFGMPMGPVQLMDEIGVDISFTVATALHEKLGDRLAPPPPFYQVVALGLTGKKGSEGLYLWENHERRLGFNPRLLELDWVSTTQEKCPPQERVRIADRLILPMVDEAVRCLEEKIVGRPREVDMAVILGLGFPAFRGGLLRYADSRGLKDVAQKLSSIYNSTPGNRSVSATLLRYAEQGRGFYSLDSRE